jgi:hypothetical protein
MYLRAEKFVNYAENCFLSSPPQVASIKATCQTTVSQPSSDEGGQDFS